jgi:galactose-1-phosphate uridylyltransferase
MKKQYVVFFEETRKDNRGNDIRVRYDPITNDVSYISTGAKPSGIEIAKAEITPSDNCIFCDKYQEPEKDAIEHLCGAVSFPNDFPTSEMDFITAYRPFDRSHGILSLDTLEESFLQQMIETEYDLAKIISQKYPSMVDFTNIGPHAGANHSHPISQRKSLPAILTGQKKSLDLVDEYSRKFWANPYDVIVKEEIDAGERVIFYDDFVYIGTRFAPTYNNEIMIIPRISVTNIIQTTESDRKFIKSTLGIFHALYELMDCQGANVCVHQAPFPVADKVRDRYRFHIHIFPRKASPPSDIGGFELGYGQQILNVLPEETATTLRKWFEK